MIGNPKIVDALKARSLGARSGQARAFERPILGKDSPIGCQELSMPGGITDYSGIKLFCNSSSLIIIRRYRPKPVMLSIANFYNYS
jgi:hypothetical protein